MRSKDELIELMRDEVAGELTLKEASGDWRADLERFALDLRASFLRHPWLASVAPYLERTLATGRYPNLQRVTAAGGDGDADLAFELTLSLVLDGIAARIAAARPSR